MKTYLIAELGSTHDYSPGNALRMIDVFSRLGASAIKFQDHAWQGTDIPLDAPHPPWFQGCGLVESRREYIDRAMFEMDQWMVFQATCQLQRVDLIASVFSIAGAKRLADVVSAFKVASGQVTNHELLRELLRIGKPVHLSSGMTTYLEHRDAVQVLEEARRPVLTSIMACVSEYPTPAERWPLHEVPLTIDKRVRRGYSDHSGGIIAPLLAVWEGAEVLEVHVTLSREMYGSDAAHSLTPEMFRELVSGIEQVEKARDSTVTRDERVAMLAKTRKQFLHGA